MLFRTACLVGSILFVACGGSGSSSGGGDGGSGNHDAPAAHDAKMADAALYDFGCGGNTACPLTEVCCAMPGHTPEFGCVAESTCQMADKIACDGPDECGGNTPVCCGVDAPDGTGTYPTCGISTLGTSCTSAAACPTHLGTSCTDTTKVQICHMSSECSDATNNQCCTFTSSGASLTFCIDATTAFLAHATCH